MGKVLIPIKTGEKSSREPGQGRLGWAEVGSRSRQGWECSSKQWEHLPGTFSQPWARAALAPDQTKNFFPLFGILPSPRSL